jgi:hypothetical protein
VQLGAGAVGQVDGCLESQLRFLRGVGCQHDLRRENVHLLLVLSYIRYALLSLFLLRPAKASQQVGLADVLNSEHANQLAVFHYRDGV